MRSFLMIAPTRVTRGSPCCAHCAPFGSASWRMLRNLITLKTLPPRPTRACLYSAGARQPSSNLMAKHGEQHGRRCRYEDAEAGQ